MLYLKLWSVPVCLKNAIVLKCNSFCLIQGCHFIPSTFLLPLTELCCSFFLCVCRVAPSVLSHLIPITFLFSTESCCSFCPVTLKQVVRTFSQIFFFFFFFQDEGSFVWLLPSGWEMIGGTCQSAAVCH